MSTEIAETEDAIKAMYARLVAAGETDIEAQVAIAFDMHWTTIRLVLQES